jgi:hypothetical protein
MSANFLASEFMMEANDYLRLPSDAVSALAEAAERIRSHERLRGLALEIRGQLARGVGAAPDSRREDVKEALGRLLAAEPLMGRRAGMFSAVVMISLLPEVIGWYRSKGIPESVLTDTLSDIGIWMHNHKQAHGAWGLSELGWIIRHLEGSLFRLGRLQFMIRSFGSHPVFRNRRTGQIAALSAAGIRYRRDGRVDGTSGNFDPEGGWTSQLWRRDGETEGHLVTADGRAQAHTVRLPAADWEQVLGEGDPVLDVHIPQGEKLDPELCRDSYRQAIHFYAEHFPGVRLKAFVCSSWLLSPQLSAILPSGSNIVRFQRDYRLLPHKSDDRQLFERVFGAKPADWRTAPRDTALRRLVADFYRRGGITHAGSGFILKEDI